jgi:hypothetical protein
LIGTANSLRLLAETVSPAKNPRALQAAHVFSTTLGSLFGMNSMTPCGRARKMRSDADRKD